MTKRIQSLIALMLVLSVGALILGSMLYARREVVKGRAQKLEYWVTRIAENLGYDHLDRQRLRDYAAMDQQLSPLAVAAQNNYEEMEAAFKQLNQAESRLQKTSQSLQAIQSEFQSSQKEATESLSAIDQKESEIYRQEKQIFSLDSEKKILRTKIEKLASELSTAEASLSDLRAEYNNLNVALADCVEESVGSPTNGTAVSSDFEGRILIVHPEWNIVVIDKGSENNVTDHTILLVHRDATPIGKIRINRVKPRISVAEIISSWEGRQVHIGDEVVSPRPS